VRRTALTIAVTIVGLVLLLQFKTHPAGSGANTLASIGSVPVTSHSGRHPAATGRHHPTRRPAPHTPHPSRSATGAPQTTPSPTTPTSRRSHPLPKPRIVTATGQVAQTRYGPVQVRIVETAGRLTDVTAIQLPSASSHSAEIAAHAAPILRSEALQANSARIDIVSGATYTSDGYAQSLQSALDNA
jgi:uncharacterized protein with FMN-binding domain